MLAGIPCGILATWTLERYGLKISILVGTWAMAIGSAVKIFR